MGCRASAPALGGYTGRQSESKQRRLLSVISIANFAGQIPSHVAECGRELLATLNAEGEEENKFLVCSHTDKELKGVPSYGSKEVARRSSIGMPEEVPHGFGYACHKGKKPEMPNQDAWFMMEVDGFLSVYAVFDGHGHSGHHISDFVKDYLPKLLYRDPRLRSPAKDVVAACLREAFQNMQVMINGCSDKPPEGMQPLSAGLAGTTATVVVHNRKESRITVAHVGDSGAACGTLEADPKEEAMKATMLTKDHKPSEPEEKARIGKAGGIVVYDGFSNHRIYIKGTTIPGINMSRCLGDLMAHAQAGVVSTPDVTERQLTAGDKLLIVCSDGIWEFMSDQEAVDVVSKYGPDRALEAAEDLAKQAWDRWIGNEGGSVVDDITALVVFLKTDNEGVCRCEPVCGA